MTSFNEFFEKYSGRFLEIAIASLVFIVFILVSLLVRKTITKRIKPKTRNPLLAEFIGKIVALIILIFGFIIFLEIAGFGSFAKHILAGAGITTFIIGFAFKDIGENFLAGILMAFKSPFQIGDLIETNGISGYVIELNLRESVIKSFDGKDVFIPNSQIIKNPLSNYTIDGFLRYEIVFGIDYNSDFEVINQEILTCLKAMPEVLQADKKPFVILDELATSSLIIKVYYWIDTSKSKSKAYHLKIKSKVITKILERLNELGIYLPADILEIKNYNTSEFSVGKK